MGSLQLLLVAALPLLVSSASIVPFPVFAGDNGFGGSTTVSASCAAAFNSTINCDPALQVLALTNAYVSPNSTGVPQDLCAPSCNSSLAAYQSNVVAQCGSSPVIDPLLKNTYIGDLFRDYYDLVCTKDTATGQFCVDFLNNGFGALAPVSQWSQLPQDLICSSCQVSFFETLQRSPFLGYNADTALNWKATQQICGLSGPLGVDPASALTFGEPNNDTVIVNATCASGSTYTVQSGDTCESIAIANSVAQGTLWAINNLLPDCSGLKVGQSLCLPKQCTLHTLEPSDTCASIAISNGLTYSTLLGYNPTINPDCSNLNVTGSVVCVSNPEGDFVPPPSNGTNPNAPAQFASAPVPPPGPTPFGTTTQCGTYYQVQVADTCERISLAAGVSVELFEDINPSIDANCFNLVTGLWYCVQPTRDWNSTSPGNSTLPTTTVPPPAPTPPGTTGACFEWHVIQSGDSCSFLQETLGVTMDQLLQWNPNLLPDCSNLLLGEAYCVAGPPSTTTSTGTTTSSPASTTSSSSTCTQTYTVVSGDFCSKIWTQFGLTEAQFRALNPSLDANCDLDIGQVLCVGGSSATPTTSQAASTTTSTPGCAQTYTVVSGDFCSKIWAQFGLTEAQFRALNPSLDANCDLDVGQVLCVAAPSSCNKTYTVLSGDFCSKIWAQFGLSEAQFRALNPTLDANCDLDVGQVLCVG